MSLELCYNGRKSQALDADGKFACHPTKCWIKRQPDVMKVTSPCALALAHISRAHTQPQTGFLTFMEWEEHCSLTSSHTSAARQVKPPATRDCSQNDPGAPSLQTILQVTNSQDTGCQHTTTGHIKNCGWLAKELNDNRFSGWKQYNKNIYGYQHKFQTALYFYPEAHKTQEEHKQDTCNSNSWNISCSSLQEKDLASSEELLLRKSQSISAKGNEPATTSASSAFQS